MSAIHGPLATTLGPVLMPPLLGARQTVCGLIQNLDNRYLIALG